MLEFNEQELRALKIALPIAHEVLNGRADNAQDRKVCHILQGMARLVDEAIRDMEMDNG